MIVVLLVLAGVPAVWLIRRRRRAVRLAGLSATAPVFSVEPPSRRLSGWRQERL